MESPQVETPNTLTLDYADSPELREIFAHKDVGHKCKLTFELQIMAKYPEGVQMTIDKVIADYQDEEKEVEPEPNKPIMAVMQKKSRTRRGMSGPRSDDAQGPHGRPPQTAENSEEPWMTSYV
jgi:hypothetical protein